MQYNLILKNEKLKSYHLLGWLFVFLQVVAITFLLFYFEDRKIRMAGWAGLIIYGLASFLIYVLKNNKPVFYLGGLLLISVPVWIAAGFYWFALIALVIALLYVVSARPKIVRFYESHIIYPSLPLKKLNWVELNNAILKDGLLTLDQRNNKLIQQMVDESKTKVDEKEFNEFCREQLK